MADQPSPENACSTGMCPGLIQVVKDQTRLETIVEERDRDRERERDRLDDISRTMQVGFDSLKQHVSTCIERQDDKRREDIQGVYVSIGELDGRLHTLKNLFITAGAALLGGVILAIFK